MGLINSGFVFTLEIPWMVQGIFHRSLSAIQLNYRDVIVTLVLVLRSNANLRNDILTDVFLFSKLHKIY